VHGDGKQTRTFTHVSDQVQGILLALGNEKSRGEVFNIGSTEEISLLALAELIKKLMGETDAKIDFIPYESFGRYEDVRRRVPDISKAKKILGFKPKIKLEGGLRDTIEWQKKVMGY
jgi:UDP-glucose 4-epimerase